MKDKILNFPEAMKLAQLILRHFNTVSLKEITGEQFVGRFFSALSDDEIQGVIDILGVDIKNDPETITTDCINGMIKNNLFEMLEAYNHLGFNK